MKRKLLAALLLPAMLIPCVVSYAAEVDYTLSDVEVDALVRNAEADPEKEYVLLSQVLYGNVPEERLSEIASGVLVKYSNSLYEAGLLPAKVNTDVPQEPFVWETNENGADEGGIETDDIEKAREDEKPKDNIRESELYGHTYNDLNDEEIKEAVQWFASNTDEDCYIDLIDTGEPQYADNDLLETTLLCMEPVTLRFFDDGYGEMLYSWQFDKWAADMGITVNLKAYIDEKGIRFGADTQLPEEATFTFKAPDEKKSLRLYCDGEFIQLLRPDESGYMSFKTDNFTSYTFKEDTGGVDTNINTENIETDTEPDSAYSFVTVAALAAVCGICIFCIIRGKRKKK